MAIEKGIDGNIKSLIIRGIGMALLLRVKAMLYVLLRYDWKIEHDWAVCIMP